MPFRSMMKASFCRKAGGPAKEAVLTQKNKQLHPPLQPHVSVPRSHDIPDAYISQPAHDALGGLSVASSFLVYQDPSRPKPHLLLMILANSSNRRARTRRSSIATRSFRSLPRSTSGIAIRRWPSPYAASPGCCWSRYRHDRL